MHAQVRLLGKWMGNLLMFLTAFGMLVYLMYDSVKVMHSSNKQTLAEHYQKIYMASRSEVQQEPNHTTPGIHPEVQEPTQRPDGGPAPYQAGSSYFNSGTELEAPNLTIHFTQEAPDYNYKSLLDARPPPFLDSYRNPCWMEPLPTTDPYNESYYYTDLFMYPRFHDVLVHMGETWASHLENGYKWRLRCMPYFYVIGFAKCATSDLYDALLEHPQIMSTSSKEIHYWSKARVKDGKTDAFGFVPLRNYIDLFDEAAVELSQVAEQRGNQIFHPAIVGDGTPSTVDYSGQWRKLPENAGGDAPKYTTGHYIHQVTPQAHVIVIVRNPVERLYSDYKYFHEGKEHSPEEFDSLVKEALGMMNNCLKNRTLWACVNDRNLYLTINRFTLFNSIYFPFLYHWGQVFPPEQLHILRFEDYKADRGGALDEVLGNLGLGPMPEDIKAQIMNKTVSNKNVNDAPMLPETRTTLENFFKPFNEQLSDFLRNPKFMWADQV